MDYAQPNRQKNQTRSVVLHRVGVVLGAVLCLALAPILAVSVTLLVKSALNPDSVPTVAGLCPLIVKTDSMSPSIRGGDLIIIGSCDPDEVREGDVISFFDPDSVNASVVTHRVVEVAQGEDGLQWVTKGDANNTVDSKPVPSSKLIGSYVACFSGLGEAALFLQSPTGIVVCVVLPVLALMAYDAFRRRQAEKRQRDRQSRLMRELGIVDIGE